MNRSVRSSDEQGGYLEFILFFFGSIAIAIPISSQSLWIDEGFTVFFASQPSFEEVINELVATHRAESLTPGYVLYMWVWINLLGSSEYNLRLSNAPFIFLVLLIFSTLPVKRIFKSAVILITCLSPFLWFYMNEARSYIAVFSFSATGLSGVVLYFYGNLRWQKIGPYVTAISLLLGSFFNMSCVFTVPALVATVLYLCSKTKTDIRKVIRDWTKPVLFSLPFFLLLGGYYLWVISEGSGGRLQQESVGPNLRNIGFVLYEFLGFTGLGPPRNVLRTDSSLDAFTPYLIWMVPLAVLMMGVAGAVGVFSLRVSSNRAWFLKQSYLWGFAVGCFCFGLFAFVAKFVFFGRHVIFVYPYFIFGIAFIISEIWRVGNMFGLGRLMVVGLVSMWLVSDIRLRFHSEYLKDDYRLAIGTAISLSKSDTPIYWAAHFITGAYYGLFYPNVDPSSLQVSLRPPTWKKSQEAYYAPNWTVEKIKMETAAFKSVVLVLSKFDLYDDRVGWRSFIKEHKPAVTREFGVFRVYRIDFHEKRSGIMLPCGSFGPGRLMGALGPGPA